jgi:hypothetical protein
VLSLFDDYDSDSLTPIWEDNTLLIIQNNLDEKLNANEFDGIVMNYFDNFDILIEERVSPYYYMVFGGLLDAVYPTSSPIASPLTVSLYADLFSVNDSQVHLTDEVKNLFFFTKILFVGQFTDGTTRNKIQNSFFCFFFLCFLSEQKTFFLLVVFKNSNIKGITLP